MNSQGVGNYNLSDSVGGFLKSKFPKHFIEFLLHIALCLYLLMYQSELALCVYVVYLLISTMLVNVFSNEWLTGHLFSSDNPNYNVAFFIFDVFSFVFATYVAYGTSLVSKMLDKLFSTNIDVFESIPKGIGFDEGKIDSTILINQNANSAAGHLQSAPFDLSVVEFGLYFYVTSRLLWIGYLFMRKIV